VNEYDRKAHVISPPLCLDERLLIGVDADNPERTSHLPLVPVAASTAPTIEHDVTRAYNAQNELTLLLVVQTAKGFHRVCGFSLKTKGRLLFIWRLVACSSRIS
jgi:hypothetical protein